MQGKEAVRATLEQIDIVHRMARRWPETFELARTAAEVERAFKNGRIASLIGMEGGHSIDNSLATLRMMHALGAGYMTLTHSLNVPWADSATDKPALGGLSKFGEEVVREMNWLGMLVDLSHVSPDDHGRRDPRQRGAGDLLALVGAGASATCRATSPTTCCSMLAEERRRRDGDVRARVHLAGRRRPRRAGAGGSSSRCARSSRTTRPTSTPAMERWRAENPEPRATLAQVADHIDHIRKVAGIDHIGLGGDFDGITTVVQGLEDVSKYPALTAELLRARLYRGRTSRRFSG